MVNKTLLTHTREALAFSILQYVRMNMLDFNVSNQITKLDIISWSSGEICNREAAIKNMKTIFATT